MLKILFSAILVSAFTFLHTGSALAASVQGTHPYDLPGRKITGTSNRAIGNWNYTTIREFETSPYKTTTHMLHPYFRSAPYQKYLLKNKNTIQLFLDMYGYSYVGGANK